MKFNTQCVHGDNQRNDVTGAVSFPIYQSATFSHPGVGQSTGYDYSRLQNPTREQLERTMAALEKGCDAMAFASGMAAATALMELFAPGDHIIVSDDLYGGTHRLFSHINRKNGLTFDWVDTGDLAAVERLIGPKTRALFIETPTNPMMKVTDIWAAAALAKAHGLLTFVDNTFLTPCLQQPLTLGADVVLHSGTKYLGGHNDTLAGFLVVADPALAERLRFIYKTIGGVLAPFDSWLLLRGIKTLSLRVERQQQSALTIARWLGEHPKIKKVHYVGLPDHPGHEVIRRQASGFGAMISFEVDSAETAVVLLERVKLVLYAESLGGVETLMTYPMLQTHADVPPEIRQAMGITDRLLRLSVGIEDCGDIIEDLQQALR